MTLYIRKSDFEEMTVIQKLKVGDDQTAIFYNLMF